MSAIRLLDNDTIDKIAAGEVVERPLSIVKELVENSMDAGADRISVEIRGGGIDLIRVTDNGRGIAREDIPMAFLRHATSKIKDIDDLNTLNSMGFRGEALSSIASVCKVTLMTKRPEDLMGYKLQINGGKAEELEEVGVPDGTTIIAAHLFYNTPVRRKFLKSATGEANAVTELMERLALARPDISYKYVVNGNTRFMTSGGGDLKETIHRIYGRDTARWTVPLSYEKDGIRIDGYLGTPAMNRPNRNFETYFLNHRYIRSDVVAKGIEEGYKGYMMQHKFPFCVLHITMDQAEIDINVHPSKMDVRFHDREGFYDHLTQAVSQTLHNREMIPEDVSRTEEKEEKKPAFEPFETRAEAVTETEENAQDTEEKLDGALDIFEVSFSDESDEGEVVLEAQKPIEPEPEPESYFIPEDPYKNAKQIEMLPKERVISRQARDQYRLIGQVFNTYWMFAYQDKLYFMDQHAAHEKVNYERFVKRYKNNEVYSQMLSPGLVVSLSPKEHTVLEENREVFEKLGFETEDFGGNEVILNAVPQETFRKNADELFLDILNDIAEKGSGRIPDVYDRVIATMACKASVKGGDEVSFKEMETILDELLDLENPYHCPHGRPTMFSMSRMELERKFKRIVN